MINKHNPPLQKLESVTDWEIFCQPLEDSLPKHH